jgi:archaellum biogenesis protein FlaJ (TadC family)
MAFWPAVVAVFLFVLSFLLFASQLGSIQALLMIGGFVLLGLLLRENDRAKRRDDERNGSDE